jgi:hypothetical protein
MAFRVACAEHPTAVFRSSRVLAHRPASSVAIWWFSAWISRSARQVRGEEPDARCLWFAPRRDGARRCRRVCHDRGVRPSCGEDDHRCRRVCPQSRCASPVCPKSAPRSSRVRMTARYVCSRLPSILLPGAFAETCSTIHAERIRWQRAHHRRLDLRGVVRPSDRAGPMRSWGRPRTARRARRRCRRTGGSGARTRRARATQTVQRSSISALVLRSRASVSARRCACRTAPRPRPARARSTAHAAPTAARAGRSAAPASAMAPAAKASATPRPAA